MPRIFCRIFLAACMLLGGVGAQASDQPYVTRGDCDGYPRLPLATAPGLCIGLVAGNLGFARGVATLDGQTYVTDMGGWEKGKGRLLRLDITRHDAAEVLLAHLDEPNSIVPSAHGTLYVAVLGKVLEFDPKSNKARDAVTGLPTDGRHPLPALVLGGDGALFINVGSSTDNCERQDGRHGPALNPCPETRESPPRGAILRIMPKPDASVDAKSAEIVARGLRNTMALATLPDGQLVVATNSRDAIDQADPKLSDEDLPHDTLDWVDKSADYGWPYCYDDNRPSPEYAAFDCSAKHLHTRLLPPHAAPLGMLFYAKGPLPGLAGNLVIPYHGYRKPGHRIVKLAVDAKGQPQGDPIDIAWNWDAITGVQPQGSPVSVAQQEDGSILITEDHNGTLLRLARDRH